MISVFCFHFFALSYLTHTASQICCCVLTVTKSESCSNSLTYCFTDFCIEEFEVCKMQDLFHVICLTREESEIFSENISSINASTCFLYFSFSLSLFSFMSSKSCEKHRLT